MVPRTRELLLQQQDERGRGECDLEKPEDNT